MCGSDPPYAVVENGVYTPQRNGVERGDIIGVEDLCINRKTRELWSGEIGYWNITSFLVIVTPRTNYLYDFEYVTARTRNCPVEYFLLPTQNQLGSFLFDTVSSR